MDFENQVGQISEAFYRENRRDSLTFPKEKPASLSGLCDFPPTLEQNCIQFTQNVI